MSSQTPSASGGSGTPQAAAPTTPTSGYSLIGSYSTVQSLSPTVTNPIEYCTIKTTPSGVIASIVVQKAVFDKGEAGVQLDNFSAAIEQTMRLPHVVGAFGTQLLDPNDLLADFVVFTVSYESANAPSGAVTAEAQVPVGYLDFSDALIGRVSWQNVQNIVTAAYNNLVSAASG